MMMEINLLYVCVYIYIYMVVRFSLKRTKGFWKLINHGDNNLDSHECVCRERERERTHEVNAYFKT